MFFGSAKSKKWCPFAPIRRLVGPPNGAYSEFPDSLWSSTLAIWVRQDGSLTAYPLKERPSQAGYTPRFAISPTNLAAAPRKGATVRHLARFAGSVAVL